MNAEKVVVGIGVAVLALIAWTLTVLNIGPMVGAPMLPLDTVAVALFVTAWTVSMVAMMFPTAVPMVMMFLHVGRTSSPEIRQGGGPSPGKAVAFVATYLGIWAATGILLYLVEAAFLSQLPVSASLFIGSPLGVGIALLVVASYQLSPLKGECLARCHPTSFLFKYYRGGLSGSARMGLSYAKHCVGCCWVMMIFLLVSATMALAWMALFTVVIFAERNLPLRSWAPKFFGVGFAILGAALIVI